VFENKEWKQNVKPSFIVDIKDATKEYDFVLTLRTTTEYKFSNLWIYMNTQTPNKESARESFEIKITNPDGSWIGKKTGTIVENSLNFKRRKLPLKGKYTFILEQGITDSKIDQVLDIGLVVTEAKKP
jgi:gliding motility-associated lipoprotein GldH